MNECAYLHSFQCVYKCTPLSRWPYNRYQQSIAVEVAIDIKYVSVKARHGAKATYLCVASELVRSNVSIYGYVCNGDNKLIEGMLQVPKNLLMHTFTSTHTRYAVLHM